MSVLGMARTAGAKALAHSLERGVEGEHRAGVALWNTLTVRWAPAQEP